MAVADSPSSFHIHPPSSSSSSPSPSPSSSSSSSSSASPTCPSPLLPSALSRCCASLARLSPCLFVASLLFFFLMLQLDVVPPMDSPQIRGLLQKLRRLPLPSTHASPSSSSLLPSRSSSSSPSAEPRNTSPTQPSSAPPSSSPSSPQDSDALDPSRSSSESAGPDSSIAMARVAICIVGGAREFELTGPSLKEYLLRSFANADVFLHAPLDKDSYKLSILGDIPNLVRFRIFTPEPISELGNYTDVLTASNSPHGVQGLLQYFNLVEGCARMIQEHQQQRGFEYKWVIRTRLDGYWNGYLVPLEEMDENAYTVPVGSQFGGLNDRLGIGNWQTSEVALSRLSLLPLIHANGGRGLNSETSFKKQLEVKKVEYKLHDFPFCVLSRRKYGWPPGHRGVPVASMFSKGHLNGAKCRPCQPVSSGAAASSIVQGLDRGWSWPGDGEGIELCNPTADWDPQWPDVYDAMAGPERASVRVMLSHQNHTECIQANEVLKMQVRFWDSPSPAMICKKGLRP